MTRSWDGIELTLFAKPQLHITKSAEDFAALNAALMRRSNRAVPLSLRRRYCCFCLGDSAFSSRIRRDRSSRTRYQNPLEKGYDDARGKCIVAIDPRYFVRQKLQPCSEIPLKPKKNLGGYRRRLSGSS